MLDSDVMEGQLLDGLLEALRELPDAQAEVSGAEQPGGRDRGHDAQVDLRVGGKAATLLIEMKKDVYPRDVRQVLWQLRDSARRWPHPGEKREAAFFLIAQSISPGAKELLRNERVGYYDSGGSLFLPAGNIYLHVDKPPPKSLSRSIRSVFSGRRAQVLHAVLLRQGEWFGVNDIANQAQVSPATASQVLMEMEKFEWVVSRGRGPGKERHPARAWCSAGCMGEPTDGDATSVDAALLRAFDACGRAGGEVRRGLRREQGRVRDHPRGGRTTVRAVSVECFPGALSAVGRSGGR